MKIIHFILLFFTFHSVFAQNPEFDKGNIVQQNYYEEIPIKLVYDKIVVPVTINGKTYQFLLDTGAPNLISKELYDELNLEKRASATLSDANNVKQLIEVIEIPSIQIGNLIFENQVATVYDLKNHNPLSCFRIDGFIGSNLLKKSIIKISKNDKKIILSDQIKKIKPKKKPTKIKLIGIQKAPYIQFSFLSNNKVVAIDWVLIDTGMDGFYEMSNLNYKIFEHQKSIQVIGKSTGSNGVGLFGAGIPSEQTLLQVETASLNNTIINNLIINTTDDNNSRIGADFLNYGDLIIDFKNENAYFEFEKILTISEKIPKFNNTIIDDKFVVGLVWDKNLEDKMSFGDEIISIDSNTISEMSMCQILGLKNILKNKVSYTIEVKNKDNQIQNILIVN